MLDKFECPSCGAALEYNGTDPVVHCSYCGSTITVPESLRSGPQPEWTGAPIAGAPPTLDLGHLIGMVAQFGAVKELARGGQLGEAAQLYQQITGLSPDMANRMVQRLAAGQSVILSHGATSAEMQQIAGPQVAQELAQLGGAAQQAGRRVSRAIVSLAVWAFILCVAALAILLLRSGVLGNVLGSVLKSLP